MQSGNNSDELYEQNIVLSKVSRMVQTSYTNLEDNHIISVDEGSSSDLLKLSQSLDIIENNSPTKIFEFCQILNNSGNPPNITLIKECVIEDIQNQSNFHNEEGTSSRYDYCREIIKRYLKYYPPDCPEDEEKLITTPSESYKEEYPDEQPCFNAENDQQENDSTNRHTVDAETNTPSYSDPKLDDVFDRDDLIIKHNISNTNSGLKLSLPIKNKKDNSDATNLLPKDETKPCLKLSLVLQKEPKDFHDIDNDLINSSLKTQLSSITQTENISPKGSKMSGNQPAKPDGPLKPMCHSRTYLPSPPCPTPPPCISKVEADIPSPGQVLPTRPCPPKKEPEPPKSYWPFKTITKPKCPAPIESCKVPAFKSLCESKHPVSRDLPCDTNKNIEAETDDIVESNEECDSKPNSTDPISAILNFVSSNLPKRKLKESDSTECVTENESTEKSSNKCKKWELASPRVRLRCLEKPDSSHKCSKVEIEPPLTYFKCKEWTRPCDQDSGGCSPSEKDMTLEKFKQNLLDAHCKALNTLIHAADDIYMNIGKPSCEVHEPQTEDDANIITGINKNVIDGHNKTMDAIKCAADDLIFSHFKADKPCDCEDENSKDSIDDCKNVENTNPIIIISSKNDLTLNKTKNDTNSELVRDCENCTLNNSIDVPSNCSSNLSVEDKNQHNIENKNETISSDNIVCNKCTNIVINLQIGDQFDQNNIADTFNTFMLTNNNKAINTFVYTAEDVLFNSFHNKTMDGEQSFPTIEFDPDNLRMTISVQECDNKNSCNSFEEFKEKVINTHSKTIKTIITAADDVIENVSQRTCDLCNDPDAIIKARKKAVDIIEQVKDKTLEVCKLKKNEPPSPVDQVKEAVEDLYIKVCNTTRETIDELKSESKKIIGINDVKKPPKPRNTAGAPNSDGFFSGLSSFRRKPDLDTEPEDEGTSYPDYVKNVMAQVHSTFSILSGNFREAVGKDKSSKYDKPSPPCSISQTSRDDPISSVMPRVPSVLTSLKEKFYSMLFEVDEEEESEVQSNPSISSINDSEKENDRPVNK